MFIPGRVAVVETVGTSLMIRGAEPLNAQNQFAYTELMQTLPQVDFNDKTFVDVCLIDNVGERPDWQIEMQAYGQNPSDYPMNNWPPYTFQPDWNPSVPLGTKLNYPQGSTPGSLVWWPIEGFDHGANPEVYLTSPGWDFAGLIDCLNVLLNTPKCIVYVHCELGTDRTGATVMGYLMKWKGMSYAAAKAVASTGAPEIKCPDKNYLNLALAYAKMIGKE
jgi:protein-tyrosine phosphatase